MSEVGTKNSASRTHNNTVTITVVIAPLHLPFLYNSPIGSLRACLAAMASRHRRSAAISNPSDFYQPKPSTQSMAPATVPKPGPAKLSPKASLPEWLAEAKQCHYLPEAVMKQLCEMVKECLMEGESHILRALRDLSLIPLSRVQHPTCLYSGHDLR